MDRRLSRYVGRLVLTGLLSCASGTVWAAVVPDGKAADYLAETEKLRRKDHTEFASRLAEFHRDPPALTARDTWELRYLDTWEAQFLGRYAEAESQLHDIIDHSPEPVIVAKANGLLLNNLATNRRYDEGFALAERIAAKLESITDPSARFAILADLSTMMTLGDQSELGAKYARMMESTIPPDESICYPYYLRMAALANGRLSASSPEFGETIRACSAQGDVVITHAAWLVQVELLLREDSAAEALVILDRIDGSIAETRYHPHMVSSHALRALAYEKLGRDDEAHDVAIATVRMTPPDEVSEWMRDAYAILYRIEKKKGDAVAALRYYEKYVVQQKGDRSDRHGRLVAYQISQQHALIQKYEAESLARQNRILTLQQALDTRTVEADRLSIVLLLFVVTYIVFSLFRVKRSQIRFRALAAHDGLTGIYHHQHFMTEASRSVRGLVRRSTNACLICIDLDHFKQVNDTHGHAVGDAALRHVVAVCKAHLRPGDLFGRLGGEEFGILLPGLSTDDGHVIAERIRLAIAASPLREDGLIVPLSASVGVSCTGRSGSALQRLCRDADAALYRAKHGGRNRVIAYEPPAPELVAT